MPKSLLSSFSNDFNRTIEVHSLTQSKNEIGEVTETWEKTDDGIKCLLLLKQEQYNKYVSIQPRKEQIEFIKTTHKIRMDFGPTIKEGDKIKDNKNVWYDVKFVTDTPGFDGFDDHLLVFCDIVR